MTAVMMADVVRIVATLADRTTLEEDGDDDAEDDDAGQLPQQRGRRRAAAQSVPDVEEYEVDHPRREESRGEADRERAVVPFLDGVDHRDVQPG